MLTKRLGNIGEAKTLAKFVELQIPVYQPFGDTETADMVVEFKGKLQKIQVKTSEKYENGKMIFSLISSTCHRKNGVKHKYSESEVDYFALYNLEADKLLLIPFKEVKDRQQLSIPFPYRSSHNQNKTLNWEDYTFEKIICVETLHTASKKDEEKAQTTTE